ncbi:hypothetical protein T11_7700 [Trichinella zimbabwensis]|uniref:Uncharacterized protein n=1 Tax=Trichinella zimbabwensis TaxID=268475 RepID=A0A0V1GA85_9BILA|nr:hypothetical protein T11_7700 [Trichinella zimbabwensis]
MMKKSQPPPLTHRRPSSFQCSDNLLFLIGCSQVVCIALDTN